MHTCTHVHVQVDMCTCARLCCAYCSTHVHVHVCSCSCTCTIPSKMQGVIWGGPHLVQLVRSSPGTHYQAHPHQAPSIKHTLTRHPPSSTSSPGTLHTGHSLTTHTPHWSPPHLHHEMLQLIVREESWLVLWGRVRVAWRGLPWRHEA